MTAPHTVTTTNVNNANAGGDGFQMGAAATDKIGFYGATPVVQRSGAVQAALATTVSTTTTPYGYTTQAQADAIVTLVNEIRATLVQNGMIKGSA
jgi:UDP-N-acetyl-D-mannosaminuronic acid transferase (WecB/TagA/CpsF family)